MAVEDKAFIGLDEEELINALTGLRLYLSFGLVLNTMWNPKESTKQAFNLEQESQKGQDWQNLRTLEKRMFTQLCNLRKKAEQTRKNNTAG